MKTSQHHQPGGLPGMDETADTTEPRPQPNEISDMNKENSSSQEFASTEPASVGKK